MVGASANNVRPSYFVLKYLLAKGYDVWPINPGIAGKEILGPTVYAALDDLSEVPDMVDIFRNSDAAGAIVEWRVAAGAIVKSELRSPLSPAREGVAREMSAAREGAREPGSREGSSREASEAEMLSAVLELVVKGMQGPHLQNQEFVVNSELMASLKSILAQETVTYRFQSCCTRDVIVLDL